MDSYQQAQHDSRDAIFMILSPSYPRLPQAR